MSRPCAGSQSWHEPRKHETSERVKPAIVSSAFEISRPPILEPGAGADGLVWLRAGALLEFGLEATVGGAVVLPAPKRWREVLLLDLRVFEVVGVLVPLAITE